jgi:hypothetical protein
MATLVSDGDYVANALAAVLGSTNLSGIVDLRIIKRRHLAQSLPVLRGSHAQKQVHATKQHAPVSSSTLNATYRMMDYQVTAWQPRGKSAFILMITMKDRHWIQPDVAEARELVDVMRNAVEFVERFLDEEEFDAEPGSAGDALEAYTCPPLPVDCSVPDPR